MRMKLVGIVLMLSFVTMSVFLGYKFRKVWMLSQEQWDGLERLTFVIMIEKDPQNGAILVSVEPETYQLFVMRLPSRLVVDVGHGYGKYSIDSLTGLARQELNWQLVTGSISGLIGAPVENWITYVGKLECSQVDAECVSVLIKRELMNDKIETSFSRVSRWRLLNAIDNLKLKESVVDGGLVSWKNENFAADGNLELIYDSEYIDARLAGRFVNVRVVDEGLTIGVINSTDQNGLAAMTGRILSGMGARVLRLDTVKVEVENCLIRANWSILDSSITVDKIKSLWKCGVEVNENPGRVDIELWLGKTPYG